MFDHATAEQFIRPAHRSIVLEAQDPEQLLEQLAAFQPTVIDKWSVEKLER
jgi:predicted Rossmann-fold nucleotide-binding protein